MSTDEQPYAPGAACWIDLVATDRDVARAFYAELFDWEITEGHATDVPYLVARHRGATVAGISIHTPVGPPPGWLTYFAGTDLAELAALIRAEGGALIGPPATEGDDGISITFRDNRGGAAGAWQAGRVLGAQQRGGPGAWLTSELLTDDALAATAFYRRVFGPGRWAARTRAGRQEWLPYIEVLDVQDGLDRAEHAGAAVDVGPHDSALGRCAHLTDPQGARIGLVQRRPE